MRRPQRTTVWVAVIIVGALAVYVDGARRLNDTVQDRREIAAEQRAEERRRSEATDLRICEQAINGTNERFRTLIDTLTAVAPPPSTPEEARRRVETQRIIAQQYRAVDCHEFVASTERGDQP